ncbi:triacylglycerol lipase OBL1-like [Salvia divinorum]
MDPITNAEKPRKYLELKPGRTNILGILRVLSSHDYTEDCKDFIESKEEIMAEQRWVVFASILAQKLLQYIDKPLSLLGLGLEMCLNILCNATNFHTFFFRGRGWWQVKKSASFVSINGVLDSRVDLDKKVEPGTKKYFASLSAMASKLAYENDHYIKNIVENTWKMEFLGLYSFWDERYEGDTTQAFLFRDSEVITVAFRGTEPFNAKDWMTDCDISWCKLPNIRGRVHCGFVKALGLLATDNHQTKPQRAYATITQLLRSHHATRLVVTGHSLGGALAVLFATGLVMHSEDELVERLEGVYTFGQPRVGDARFGEFMEERFRVWDVEYYRFVYNYDIVPRLPFDTNALMFRHFGRCIYINSLYEAKIVEEEPLKNYFDLGSMVTKRVDAMWEVVRSFLLPRMFGPDYKEGFVLLMFRMSGLLFPDLPDHGLQDYINATRLATY